MRIRSTDEISGRAVALIWVLALAALSSLRRAARGGPDRGHRFEADR
ncbi:MAG: hypothetical protein L0206_17250 [Actinobacteria bacterium]|nr:hypothetical protein [Actinomycetota bacterium]